MADPLDDLEVTENRLLGGRVVLRQPAHGYRVAIDPVLLAAAVPAESGELVLDLGCGVGAASLCLLTRVQGVGVAGLELQRPLVRLAGQNAALNGLSGRCTMMEGSLLQPPPRLSPGMFHHVMANPPHLPPAAGRPPENPMEAASSVESDAKLADWVRVAATMVRTKGTVTFVHRADRLDALLAVMREHLGGIVVFPLWPGIGKPAVRVLVRARRSVATPMTLMPGLLLHGPDGNFTPEAEAVLREAAPLHF
jgi:tRNA1(Val) A37 N6-methylase TrmN6